MTDVYVNGGNRRVLQVTRVKKGGWTRTVRRKFLAVLAETCNVRMATDECGMKAQSAYDIRKRDPEFAALWVEALAIGYERLEEALLRHALTSVNDIAVGEHRDEIDAELGETKPGQRPRVGSGLRPDRLGTSDVQVALAILNRHRATVEGRGAAVRMRPRRTPEQTDAALRVLLDGLGRKLARAKQADESEKAGDGQAGREQAGREQAGENALEADSTRGAGGA